MKGSLRLAFKIQWQGQFHNEEVFPISARLGHVKTLEQHIDIVIVYKYKKENNILQIIYDGLNTECGYYMQYKCEGVIGITQLASPVYDTLNSLVCDLDFMCNINDILKEYDSTSHQQLESIFTGFRGRPAFSIPKEILEMFSNKFTISAMAKMLNVSDSTVKRRIQNDGLSISSKYANLGQQDLDNIVKEILEQFPKTGYKSMIGYLMASGYRVQEKKVQEAMHRVDPEGVIA